MAGYYKKIKGKDYDRKLIEMAEASVEGAGDGRISMRDARALISAVKDSGTYSDVEKRTMSYIRDHFKFTDSGDAWFRTEIRKWAATKGAKAGKAPVKAAPKKAAPKKAAAKKPASRKPAVSRQERLLERPAAETTPARREEQPKAPAPAKKRSMWKWLLLILVILIVIFFILVLNRKVPINCFNKTSEREDEDRFGQKNQDRHQLTLIEDKGGKGAEEPQVVEKTAAKTETKAAVKETPAVKEEPDKYDYYTVGLKDSLVGISEKVYGDYRKWSQIYMLNRDVIKDPKMIFQGQRLKLPKKQ